MELQGVSDEHQSSKCNCEAWLIYVTKSDDCWDVSVRPICESALVRFTTLSIRMTCFVFHDLDSEVYLRCPK